MHFPNLLQMMIQQSKPPLVNDNIPILVQHLKQAFYPKTSR